MSSKPIQTDQSQAQPSQQHSVPNLSNLLSQKMKQLEKVKQKELANLDQPDLPKKPYEQVG